MDSKRCSKCKQLKLLSEFNTRPDRPSGYRSECKKCQYKRQHKNRKLPPIQLKAYCRLHYALKTGKIIKPKLCEKCHQYKKLQGHHPDYSKPLEVEWLCQQCHNKVRKIA